MGSTSGDETTCARAWPDKLKPHRAAIDIEHTVQWRHEGMLRFKTMLIWLLSLWKDVPPVGNLVEAPMVPSKR